MSFWDLLLCFRDILTLCRGTVVSRVITPTAVENTLQIQTHGRWGAVSSVCAETLAIGLFLVWRAWWRGLMAPAEQVSLTAPYLQAA